MPILRYENLSHSDLASLPRDRTVIFMPTGPLEQHGPHLPLGVDAFSAAFFTEKVCGQLEKSFKDWNFVLFPTLFAGSDTLTYMGSIEVSPRVLYNLVFENCKQLARDGFRTIIAVSGHGGPRHNVVLEEVSARMRWRHKTRMINASGRVLYDILGGDFIAKINGELEKKGDRLGEAEAAALKTDFHGGLLETSLMMVARPELVNPVYKELKPAIIGSFWKLKRTSGKSAGEGLGHLGSPALARPAIGEAAVEVLLGEMVPKVERFLRGENIYGEFRTKLYYIPIFRTHFRTLLYLGLYLGLMSFLFLYLSRYAISLYK